MRTPRVVILVFFFSASLFLVLRSLRSLREPNDGAVRSTSSTVRRSSFRTFFSFTSPFSLFPPNAAISLTDDNSTFFPARPAAFGPPLPCEGLSGQLWIGSGFSDDHLQEGEGEGELGCSDLPGWEDGPSALAIKTPGQGSSPGKSAAASLGPKNSKRDGLVRRPSVDPKVVKRRHDGTDDYLHQDLEQTRGNYNQGSGALGSSHADIQSMQETAEITGRIALLSRGGCGFLEKVKWAQRRGAIALIVGDNIKGGPLIQMFARGNVDNVTIPSIFTSRTTAILLSSLMQPGSFIEDILDENGKPILKVQHSAKSKKTNKADTTTSNASRAGKSSAKHRPVKTTSTQDDSPPPAGKSRTPRRSWLSRLFHWGNGDSAASDRSRPPSSGRLDWVVVDEWSDENDKIIKTSLDRGAKGGGETGASASVDKASGDGFQIGVEDWRDPDLVGTSSKNSAGGSAGDDEQPRKGQGFTRYGGKADPSGLRGGSITPGSGEYVPGARGNSHPPGSGKSDSSSSSPSGIMSKLFGDDGDDASSPDDTPELAPDSSESAAPAYGGTHHGDNRQAGLWVTIAPTGGASAFFDTLGVLVISPLITLSVVYTLLFVRAKVRRRRWRAPKSVVDRLPVRTYHTVQSPSSPGRSPKLPSPSSASATTPLLQDSSRTRPRSRTTTGVPEAGDVPRLDGDSQGPRRSPANRDLPNNWAATYTGKQTECVICLEDYVDGVSKVMSLPCGHEFHADCITPWLTTRRRTCPICKGDVVRSMARLSQPHDLESETRDSEESRASPAGSNWASGHADPGFFSSRSTEPTRLGGVRPISSTSRNVLDTSPQEPDDTTSRTVLHPSEIATSTDSATPKAPAPESLHSPSPAPTPGDATSYHGSTGRVNELASWKRERGETPEQHMERLRREWESSPEYRSRVWYDSDGNRHEPYSAWNHHRQQEN